MGATAGVSNVAKGRPKKPTGRGTAVRIDADIASKAKYLASLEGVTLGDYLSRLLRADVEKAFKAAGKRLME